MAPMLFDQPIYVKRTNFIQEIACVEDALDFWRSGLWKSATSYAK